MRSHKEPKKILQPCEDAVSRKAVIDYLHTNMAWYDENGSIADDSQKLRDITNLVNGIPPVTPTRKKGKWTFDDGYPDSLICNKCRAKFDMWHWEQKQMHYCPNCGVEMESEE